MKRLEHKKKIAVTSFIICVLFFFIFYRVRYLVPGIAEHVGSCILYPFLKIQSYCIEPLKISWHNQRSISLLNQEIELLQTTCDALRAENGMLKSAQAFMDDIQEVIEFKKRYNLPYMKTAQIIARHSSADEQYIYVDVGALSGITQNMIALYQMMIVGRVVEVYPWYSKVQLVTDPLCTIAVYDAQTKARGIYRGTGSEHGSLTWVNHLDTICVGDELFSSGDGRLFPRGYLVGTVASCQAKDLYHTIHVNPSLSLERLRYCMLIDSSCGRDA